MSQKDIRPQLQHSVLAAAVGVGMEVERINRSSPGWKPERSFLQGLGALDDQGVPRLPGRLNYEELSDSWWRNYKNGEKRDKIAIATIPLLAAREAFHKCLSTATASSAPTDLLAACGKEHEAYVSKLFGSAMAAEWDDFRKCLVDRKPPASQKKSWFRGRHDTVQPVWYAGCEAQHGRAVREGYRSLIGAEQYASVDSLEPLNWLKLAPQLESATAVAAKGH
eukprot:TRINITY_DN13385_c0_g1_i1.p1 TRINITY_DN13385_c0_g1~~TRINITY_DN13385_c0_g1_i1.p1  ORF type:complete len:223 (-),score=33.14 TRINITY_DN13385_c0_g1_i1:16-684(-)